MRAAATSITNTNLRIALPSASRSGCSGRVDYLMEAANVSPFDQPKPCEGRACERGLSVAARKYALSKSVTDFKEFSGRCHYIIGQEGWQEVARYALSRTEKQLEASRSRSSRLN